MAKQITQKLGFDASQALRSLTNLRKGLDATTSSLQSFKGAGGNLGQLQQLPKTLDKAAKKSNDFVVSWQTIARVVQTQILLRGINAITSALGNAVERARELGLRIAEIQTIGQALNMTSADMSRKIIDASSEVAGVSAADFAEGVYQTLSNQVVQVGEAFNFTSQAAILGKVTMVDTKDAINALSSVMNSYGMNAQSAGHVSDTLFKTVELGRLRLGDLANILGRVTPLTAELGIKWEEVAASVAVMTRQGTRADTALTQLRAIVSTLLKPSDDLGKIFERWGVRDAKAAIAAFGGLGGVLKKLSQETGGSSNEMADLLKNVRAISGFFGTMTEEGKALDAALKGITESTGALKTAWETFKLEPAQELTKRMETYENTLTQIGVEGLPLIVDWMKIKNMYATLGLKIIRWWNGEYTIQGKYLKGIVDQMEAGSEELEIQREILARMNKKDWQEALKNVNLYYTELNKREINFQKVRDNSLAGAAAVFEQAGKNIVDIYSEAIKELDAFIKKAKDAGKDSEKEIAGINKRISDTKFQNKLEGTPDRMKMGVFDQEYASQLRKVVDAFGAIDASSESKERAMNEAQILESLGQQGVEQARQMGHAATIRKWQGQHTAAMEHQRSISELSAKEQKAAIPAAEEKLELMKLEESRLKTAVKSYTELRMELSKEKDPGVRKNIEEQIAALKEEMKTIFKNVDLSLAFFESLGIGENLTLLSSELEVALNKAEKDWEAEFQRMRAVFTRQTIPIKLAADPSGLVERAATAMGMQKTDKQTEGEFAAEVTEKAVATQNRYTAGLVELKALEVDKNNIVQAGHKILDDNVSVIRAAIVESGKASQGTAKFDEARLRHYKNYLEQLWKGAQAGKEITKEEKFVAEELRKIAVKHNSSIETAINNYAQLIGMTSDLAKAEADIAAKKAEMPTEEQNQATWDVVHAKQAENKQLGENNNLSAEAQLNTDAHAEALRDSVLPATQNAVDKTGELADNSKAAYGSAFLFGQRIGDAIPSLSTVADIALTIAERWERAATASAKVGGGGGGGEGPAGYFGGPMSHLAFGGRGQDKIPAMLSRGETVVNARKSQRFFSELNAMNQGSQPVYREQGGTVTNVGDINVTVQGGDSSQQTVREIGRAMRREVQRGTIKLR